MHPASIARVVVIGVWLAAAGAPFSLAQEPTAPADSSVASARSRTGLSAGRLLTGKERLGEKWQDEQRIDNCKVPIDKRGTKPRPDTCPPSS